MNAVLNAGSHSTFHQMPALFFFTMTRLVLQALTLILAVKLHLRVFLRLSREELFYCCTVNIVGLQTGLITMSRQAEERV